MGEEGGGGKGEAREGKGELTALNGRWDERNVRDMVAGM